MARRLVKHPVGELPPSARWYLAGLAAMALIMIAIHAMQQERMQAEVRQGVQQWLDAVGADAREVRYRMLRGLVQVDGLAVSGDGLDLQAERVQWLATLVNRASQPPAIHAVRVWGLRLTAAVSAQQGLAWFAERLNDNKGLGLLLQADSLHVDGGTVRLVDGDERIALTQLQLRLAGQKEERRLHAGVQAFGGSMHLAIHWRRPQQAFAGDIRWHRLDLAPLAARLADRVVLEGRSDGGLTVAGDWGLGLLNASGHARLYDVHLAGGPGHVIGHAERMYIELAQWQRGRAVARLSLCEMAGGFLHVQLPVAGAEPTAGVFAQLIRLQARAGVQIELKRLVLADMRLDLRDPHANPPLALPLMLHALTLEHRQAGERALYGRALMGQTPLNFSGRLDGERWHVSGRAQGVPLAGIAAYLPPLAGRHLTRGTFSGDFTVYGEHGAWRTDLSGELADLVYAADGKTAWRAERIRVRKGRILPLEQRLIIDGMEVHGGLMLVRLEGVSTAPATSWQLQSNDVRISQLAVGISAAGGSDAFMLPPLFGSAKTDAQGFFVFDLASRGEGENWHLQGRIDVPAQTLTAQASAGQVLLSRLRPVLPSLHLSRSGGEPELAGTVDAQLSLGLLSSALHVSGDVTGHDVAIAHGGDEWRAKRVHIELADVGSGLKQQHLRSMDVDDWHYHLALRPLAKQALAEASFAADGSLQAWRLDHARLRHGVVSVGAADAHWLQDVTLALHGLAAGSDADIAADGQLSGGDFSLRGKADVLSPLPRLELHASFKHATPFFLGPWLSLSGMPRIIRGRLQGDLRLRSKHDGHYSGEFKLLLANGQWQEGVFADDPMVELVGFTSHAAFERLADNRGDLALTVPVQGEWRKQALGMAVVGQAILAELQRRLRQPVAQQQRLPFRVIKQTHVRLRDRGAFSQNERQRLWRMARLLLGNKALAVELEPQLGQQAISPELIARVRYTQEKIEAYLRHRGVGRTRIFPVWPTVKHQAGELSGIRILARQR